MHWGCRKYCQSQVILDTAQNLQDNKPAAEGENGVVIIQGKGTEELLQIPEAVLNLRWIRLVGFGVGLVKLIQDSGTFLVTGIQGMGLNIGSKALQKLFHSGTSKKFW